MARGCACRRSVCRMRTENTKLFKKQWSFSFVTFLLVLLFRSSFIYYLTPLLFLSTKCCLKARKIGMITGKEQRSLHSLIVSDADQKVLKQTRISVECTRAKVACRI